MDCRRNHRLRFPKWQESSMSDRKLRLVAQHSTLLPQPEGDAFRQVNCVDKPGSPASAEENLRLIKAFNVIADNRKRSWLIELVEHFAGLECVTR
jgi:hypothetical protein